MMVSQYGLNNPQHANPHGNAKHMAQPLRAANMNIKPGARTGASPPKVRGGASPPRARPKASVDNTAVVPGPGHYGQMYADAAVSGPATHQHAYGHASASSFDQDHRRGHPAYAPQQQRSVSSLSTTGPPTSKQSKTAGQILPPYLRGMLGGGGGGGGGGAGLSKTAGARRGGGGSGGPALQRSYSEDFSGKIADKNAIHASVQPALSASPPGGSSEEMIYGLDTGETSAYPLLGFDATLPERSYESVKQSLMSFETAAVRPGKRRGVVFPPIRQVWCFRVRVHIALIWMCVCVLVAWKMILREFEAKMNVIWGMRGVVFPANYLTD